MRTLRAIVVGLLAVCLASCQWGEKRPEDAPKEALEKALEALVEEDYDAYLSYVDFGMELDSLQEASMRNVVRQHQEWKRAERAAVMAVEVIDVHLQSDSVCMAHYQYVFADSTKEIVSQKMVRQGSDWKIRFRN